MIQNETTYETIKRMKSTNEWDFCLAHFDRAWTLDFYFRLYELVIKYYPKRKYGYATKAVANPLIINELGGGYSQTLKKPDVLEPHTVRQAVHLMEEKWTL